MNNRRYVCCLKYGTKYSAEYVNKLYRMVQGNLTLEHEFVCFTENPNGISDEIRIEPLPKIPVTGWWFKPMFFDRHFPLQGTLLFLDLDLIIFNNIDNLFEYGNDEFCIIRDFNRASIRNYEKFNSSVFRLTSGKHSHVYEKFKNENYSATKRFMGDQDWIRHCVTSNFLYWPDEWIQSYKWEMRKRAPMNSEKKGERDFKLPGNPIILPQTSIAVFHGDPNPHNCKDPWVIDNWQKI